VAVAVIQRRVCLVVVAVLTQKEEKLHLFKLELSYG
jgi:hypothetical protein